MFTALIRKLLTIAATALGAHAATKAYADALNSPQIAEGIISVLGLIATIIWTVKTNTKQAVIQKAADLTPSGKVIVSTDSQPEAKITTPEGATQIIKKDQ